jgi:putative transposase
LVATLVRTIFAQPDAASTWTQHAATVEKLTERFPAAAELLADAGADLLAFTGFPKEHRKQMLTGRGPDRTDLVRTVDYQSHPQ